MEQAMAQSPSQAPPSAQLMEMIFGFALSRSIAVAAQFGVADLLKLSLSGTSPRLASFLIWRCYCFLPAANVQRPSIAPYLMTQDLS